MTIFKNLDGFTFIETAIAVTIIGMVFTPLLMVQSNIIKKTSNSFEKISRIFYINNLFTEAKSEEKNEINKKIEDPASTMQYKINKLNEKSSLKNFENIYITKATSEWYSGKQKKEETIISFHFSPKKDKEEK